jgi:hypothetical protein
MADRCVPQAPPRCAPSGHLFGWQFPQELGITKNEHGFMRLPCKRGPALLHGLFMNPPLGLKPCIGLADIVQKKAALPGASDRFW